MRMIVLFEGRDAAGKGGTIRRVTRFMNEKHCRVVALGRPTEEQRSQLAAVQVATDRPVGSLSALTIGELVAVIADSKLFVGNDSGPAHIAAAMQVPLVVLFGPASSMRWRPWGRPSEVVQNYFPCNPCSMHTCEAFDQPECIRSISVDQVMKAIEKVMKTDNVTKVK